MVRKVKHVGIWGAIGTALLGAAQLLSPAAFAFLGPWAVPVAAGALALVQFGVGYLTKSGPEDFQIVSGAEGSPSFAPSHGAIGASAPAPFPHSTTPAIMPTAQEKLQGASQDENRSLEEEARSIIDEVFDDEGDRAVIGDAINGIVDNLTESELADTVVGFALDGIIHAYHATA